MLNEKYNNPNSWKKELDQLSVLPGDELYDTNAAWEKLDMRLNTKKENNNNKVLFYWLAAACVFVSVLIAGMLGNNKNQIDIQPIANNNTTAVKKEPAQTFTRENTHDKSFKTQSKKNKKAVSQPNTIGIVTTAIIKKDNNHVLQTATDKKDSIQSIVKQNVKSQPIVFSTLKKKLPVIHINDLEKPVDPIEAVAGNNDRPSFRIRLFSRDLSQRAPAVNNENNINISIKLSPQN